MPNKKENAAKYKTNIKNEKKLKRKN